MKTILGITLYILAIIGTVTLLNLILISFIEIISVSIVSIIYIAYVNIWYKELSTVEESLLKEPQTELKIPVIGKKPINWDDYRDIPKYTPEDPIIFDRNKLIT